MHNNINTAEIEEILSNVDSRTFGESARLNNNNPTGWTAAVSAL